MDVLTKCFSTILAVSVATERMVEILKGSLPNFWLFKTDPDPAKESQRCACLRILAGILGALVAKFGDVDVFKLITGQASGWFGYVAVGLLASGGSALWNHLLDLVQAAKVNSQQAAIAAVSANQQKQLIVPSHPASLARAITRLQAPSDAHHLGDTVVPSA